MNFNYTPDGQTLRDFMASDAFVRGIQGPIGSGKSVCCVVELLRQALLQPRAIDPNTAYYDEKEKVWKGQRTGKRKVRTAVVRNTTPQLEMTTMKTWLEWMPEDEFGKIRWRAPYRHDIRIPELDLEWEVWFLALDREEDVKKLLSFELTNIWYNEARELSRGIITAGISRLKRFPRAMDGGSHRFFAIMDTNAPDEEHWWAIMSGQVEAPDWMNNEDRLTLLKPNNWEFFIQPPAIFDIFEAGQLVGYELNPERDNARFTDESYYVDLREGQSRDWIRNMLQNKIGRIFAGRPVYQGFNEKFHVAPFLEVDPAEPIYCGVDFGLTPAAAFGQDVRGQVRVIDELVTRDMHTEDFARLLAHHIRQNYHGQRIIMCGDPRGDDRQPNQSDAYATAYQIFRKHGLDIEPAWSNDPLIRTGAVQTQLNTMVDGRPAYVLSEKCKYLLNGKKGGYCYKKDGDTIDKGIYSHVADAEQYMFLKMGYGKTLIGAGQAKRHSVQANRKQDLFSRGNMSAKRRHREASILSRGR